MNSMETKKKCSHCGKVKPRSEFGKNTRAKDGLDYACKPCRRIYNRKQYSKNSESRKAAVQRIQNRDKRELAWYRENYPQEGEQWNEQ